MQKKNWVVLETISRQSKHGNQITEVRFVNGFAEQAYTYLDQSNHNYSRWRLIVSLCESGAGVIVTGLEPRSGGKRSQQYLVSADSAVRIQHTTEHISEVLTELAILLDSKL